ncbi:MAG: GNAT family N-acetyltransferase [Proteobacteria bacterium]|nr:GNAT family N-acetyltransferase [Pseudomonadota bacterium]MDA1357896.1 GNAT family N-acetyltransferase [Pseudomonadota bacterium]
MIRACDGADFHALLALINAAAEAYRGIIPADRWKEPYMPAQELADEIAAGIRFHGFEGAEVPGSVLQGVMGVQDVQDVTLIRHAYVDPAAQRQGIGAALLASCSELAERPLLIGTWAAAAWAIGFYEKHGFQRTSPADKDRLLRSYWTIPERQIETSVVLADARWFEANAA